MAELTDTPGHDEADWSGNYFNYFTEIEEHLQRARGSAMFLLSPLDWALVESWKNSGIPLDSVLKGIDAAFEKWRARKSKRRMINSLAYCAQAVLEAAERTPANTRNSGSDPLFTTSELSSHFHAVSVALRERPEPQLQEASASVEVLEAEVNRYVDNLEELEIRLTALEEKIIAILRSLQSDSDLLATRQSLDRELRPYRGKMNAEQLGMLERRYLDTALLEHAKIPRLSLFYLR